jgi:carbon monoxide dehydrogenase subunit G
VAIRIEERFVVNAPVERVWEWLVDPRKVVTCLPGAELQEVVDERTFHGGVKVKVGAITVSYRGTVRIAERDDGAHRVRMTGEGRESAGAGSARMTMESRVAAAAGGGAEIVVVSDVDVVGRIVQLGRGMIEGVAHQLFLQFAACMRARLEAESAAAPAASSAAGAGAPAAARAAAGEAPAPAVGPRQPEPAPAPQAVRALPLLMRAFWAWVLSLFRGAARRGR